MADHTVMVRRGGRIYRATWSLAQGYVRVLSPYGTAEGRAGPDPAQSAEALLNRVVDLWEEQAR